MYGNIRPINQTCLIGLISEDLSDQADNRMLRRRMTVSTESEFPCQYIWPGPNQFELYVAVALN